jgi:DNA-binding transcriptional regulator YhcF (GntR family)
MPSPEETPRPASVERSSCDLDVERGSDVPISTQIYWQLAYQIDSGRLLPGVRLPPVRELGAALRVNPNTIRAVYRRLADAGYVTSRHGAGTHVADRPPQRRGTAALSGIVAEMLRRAASAGFTVDECGCRRPPRQPSADARVRSSESCSRSTKADADTTPSDRRGVPDLGRAEGSLLEEP